MPVEVGKMSNSIFSGKRANGQRAQPKNYVSILNRFDEPLNIHKKRREMPPTPARQRSPGHLDAFLRWVLIFIREI